MKKRNEADKLTEASANTAAAADTHEAARQRLQAAQDTVSLRRDRQSSSIRGRKRPEDASQRNKLTNQARPRSTSSSGWQARRQRRVLWQILRTHASRPQTTPCSRLPRTCAHLSASRPKSPSIEAQLELAAKLIELAPLHYCLAETLAQHLALGGVDRPAGLDATFAWAHAIQAEAEARAPKAPAAPDPNRSVIILRAVGVPNFGQFCPGDTAGFPHHKSQPLWWHSMTPAGRSMANMRIAALSSERPRHYRRRRQDVGPSRGRGSRSRVGTRVKAVRPQVLVTVEWRGRLRPLFPRSQHRERARPRRLCRVRPPVFRDSRRDREAEERARRARVEKSAAGG